LAKDRRNLIINAIHIEDDAWIRAVVIILPEVTIHKGAVIGAGAAVTKDVKENTLVVGVPAKPIKIINNKI